MGVKVIVETESTFTVELPINSFSEILTNNMSLEESDELVQEEIYKKYGHIPDTILTVNPYEY